MPINVVRAVHPVGLRYSQGGIREPDKDTGSVEYQPKFAASFVQNVFLNQAI